MATWIHVRQSDKLPVKRGSNTSPFEEFPTDPNPNYGDPEFEFLPVVRDYTEPAYNQVTQRLQQYRTVGVDGTYEGHYVAGPPEEWRQEWEVVARTLAEAKQFRLDQLEEDKQTRLAAGHVDGANTFELSEFWFGLLTHKRNWYSDALAAGVIQAGRKARLRDRNGIVRIFQNETQFKGFFNSYGLVYDNIQEVDITAANAIVTANSLGALDAITWTFPA